ncbi:hypothetical protein K488DRAFT_78877 [Vararia minispora EC-137]|uniref:Uncharacterized protein n=1 Tax=Vararia minispora EC-137 TaxID=1314806 RepID=A0ACB8QJ36_9AGAM|nr:hypothetical protein K488DRAFT_78877 [Vararia minispora EC-137]
MAPIRRVALITGAAQGIGLAIALRLADDGLDVALNDLPSKLDALNAAVRAVEGKGGRALVVSGDVSVDEQVNVMVGKTVEILGRLDVMVANAAIAFPFSVTDAEPDAYDKIFAVNVRGVALCYKYAAQQMIKQGWGGRLIGSPGLSAYSASKFAIRGLSQTAALELRRHRITVNTYAPGMIDTPGLGRDAMLAMEQKRMPKQPKAASVDVVASLVSYLASEEAYHITGEQHVPFFGPISVTERKARAT